MGMTIEAPQAPSLLRRLGALLYDGILLLGLLMLAILFLIVPYDLMATRPYPHHGDLLYRTLLQAYLLAVIGGFYVYFWTHGGQTLGMRTWRFRVLRDDGAPLKTADALRRFAWATLSLAPAGLGLWWCLLDSSAAWCTRSRPSRSTMTAGSTSPPSATNGARPAATARTASSCTPTRDARAAPSPARPRGLPAGTPTIRR